MGNLSEFSKDVVVSPISTTWPSIDPAYKTEKVLKVTIHEKKSEIGNTEALFA